METGFAAVFQRLRDFVKKRYGEESLQHEFINCPLCIGFWLSCIAALYAIFFFQITLDYFFPLWFGIAGLQTFLHRIANDV